jgi:hypothetical protein
VSIAGYDAAVTCWEATFADWAARPSHLDAPVTPLFPTPSHPSDPSGHSVVVGATSTVLGARFPRDAACFTRNAEEMAASRLWAGIHVRSDNEAGLALGRSVAQAVLERARVAAASAARPRPVSRHRMRPGRERSPRRRPCR